jgi:PHS family inorganic phosphate transporter-like MFS transporter
VLDPDTAADALRTLSVGAVLDEAPLSKFHRRAVIACGVGFFTDAFDLFVVSTVATLATLQWHLSTTETSWVTGAAILGAFVGAITFGRIADMLGRRRIFILVAGIMILGAVAGALSPNGGDYPVSAVLMSEYSNRMDRGRLVGMVFSTQALGLVVGPIVAMTLLASGVSHPLTWRLLLGAGALPAAAVIYLRSKMPESPRYVAQVDGEVARAALVLNETDLHGMNSSALLDLEATASLHARVHVLDMFRRWKLLSLVIGTAGSWFLFDYAYYGNTLSLPVILKAVDPHATLIAKLALTLGIFVVFAVPGYALAVWRMDRIGHRRLQLLGFGALAVAFIALGAFHVLTASIGLFIAVFGASYFFVEFGPNTMTFVLPSEVFPVSIRTTGHGFAAGIGKLGAFVGVFLVPQFEKHIGLRGMLLIAGGAAILGFLATTLLPEASGKSIDQM